MQLGDDEDSLPGPVYALWQVYAQMWIGAFEKENYESGGLIALVLAVGCSLFMVVVMMNLLIAIIQSTYMRVRTFSTESFYKELASLVVKLDLERGDRHDG